MLGFCDSGKMAFRVKVTPEKLYVHLGHHMLASNFIRILRILRHNFLQYLHYLIDAMIPLLVGNSERDVNILKMSPFQ